MRTPPSVNRHWETSPSTKPGAIHNEHSRSSRLGDLTPVNIRYFEMPNSTAAERTEVEQGVINYLRNTGTRYLNRTNSNAAVAKTDATFSPDNFLGSAVKRPGSRFSSSEVRAMNKVFRQTHSFLFSFRIGGWNYRGLR